MSNLDIQPRVYSLNISQGGIPKSPVQSVFVSAAGLEGDGPHDLGDDPFFQAVCLQDIETLEDLREEGYPVFAGTTGENLTVESLRVSAMAIGTILSFPGGVVLEITRPRRPGSVLDRIHPKFKEDSFGRCGMYARVLQEGFIAVDDPISVDSSHLQVSQR